MRLDERRPEESDFLDVPLEGDEGEVELQRHHDVGRQLLESHVADVSPMPALTISEDASVAETVEGMKALHVDAVIVVSRRDPRQVVGIFTERDRLIRVDEEAAATTLMSAVMTPSPESLRMRDSLAYALNRMSTGKYCHLPIVDDAGAPVAMLSVGNLLDFIVECIPEEILNLPPEPVLKQPYRIDSE